MIPRIFGPYEPIRRDYPIREYLMDARPHGVAKSIYVQTNWGPGRGREEVEWVEEVNSGNGWPHAIVAHVDILSDGFGDQLAWLSDRPLVRGVRMQLFHHPNPAYCVVDNPEVLNDPRLRINLHRVADAGLSFDLQVFPHQMEAAARLVEDVPELRFVLVHAGMLEDSSKKGWSAWRSGMRLLAGFPNLSVKISGLNTFVRHPGSPLAAAITAETVAEFGPDRCMFGSNFPVEKLWTTFGDTVEGVLRGLQALDPPERAKVMASNAEAIYKL
jgi:predicted TIM-barrel fold metal-dependent hydrolase